MRGGSSDAQLSEVMAQVWKARTDRYSEVRAQNTPRPTTGAKRIEMSYIGG